jgi:hypothetical protein
MHPLRANNYILVGLFDVARIFWDGFAHFLRGQDTFEDVTCGRGPLSKVSVLRYNFSRLPSKEPLSPAVTFAYSVQNAFFVGTNNVTPSHLNPHLILVTHKLMERFVGGREPMTSDKFDIHFTSNGDPTRFTGKKPRKDVCRLKT